MDIRDPKQFDTIMDATQPYRDYIEKLQNDVLADIEADNENAEKIACLLAVARAAYIYDYCMDEDIERKERLLLIMRAALADVEDLL